MGVSALLYVVYNVFTPNWVEVTSNNMLEHGLANAQNVGQRARIVRWLFILFIGIILLKYFFDLLLN